MTSQLVIFRAFLFIFFRPPDPRSEFFFSKSTYKKILPKGDYRSDESWEESETRVRNYIDEHLNIDKTFIQFERAPRIRGKTSPRPINVRFLIYKDRENVLKAYCEKRKKTL